MEMADPQILDLNKPYVLKHRSKPTPRPVEVIQMMKSSSRAQYVPIAIPEEEESNSEPEFDEPQVPAGLPSLMLTQPKSGTSFSC